MDLARARTPPGRLAAESARAFLLPRGSPSAHGEATSRLDGPTHGEEKKPKRDLPDLLEHCPCLPVCQVSQRAIRGGLGLLRVLPWHIVILPAGELAALPRLLVAGPYALETACHACMQISRAVCLANSGCRAKGSK